MRPPLVLFDGIWAYVSVRSEVSPFPDVGLDLHCMLRRATRKRWARYIESVIDGGRSDCASHTAEIEIAEISLSPSRRQLAQCFVRNSTSGLPICQV